MFLSFCSYSFRKHNQIQMYLPAPKSPLLIKLSFQLLWFNCLKDFVFRICLAFNAKAVHN